MKFGTDGTLYCTSFRPTYRQARNLVPDGTFGQISGVWSVSNASIEGGTGYGYRSYRRVKLNSTTGIAMLETITPMMTTPIAGHKYYGGCMYKTSGTEGTSIGGDTRFEWYIADSSSGTLVFGSKNVHTGGKWKKLSSIQTLASVTTGNWKIRNFTASSSTEMYVCRHIIIDLTDTFGAGNEPTKAWCDDNIREWDTFINYGTAWENTPKGGSNWYFEGCNAGAMYDWGSLNSNWEPVEYMYCGDTKTSVSEAFMITNDNCSLMQGIPYYVSYDAKIDNVDGEQTVDVYWPIAEPSFGRQKAYKGFFCESGGMKEWRRYSWLNDRSSFSSGSYQARFDMDNLGTNMTFRLTAIGGCYVSDIVLQYNTDFGTAITLSNINKAWCDRWIDHRSSPILHIGDHNSAQIKMKRYTKIAKRKTVYQYSEENLKNYCNITTQDTWTDFDPADNTHLADGDRICFACTIPGSSEDIPCYFIGIFKGFDGTTLLMYNESYCKQGSAEYTACEQGYDIECNDIEIRPEVDSITFKPNGTIVCKRLELLLNH